jgi:hypothetical protein
MTARLLTLLATAVLGGALLAGCGGGSKSSSQTTTTATTPPAASTPGSGLTGAGLAQAIAQCKAAVQAEKALPADAKQKLDAVCPAAAKGENGPVKRVAEEVCSNVIKGSAIPAGPAREQALAACKKVK